MEEVLIAITTKDIMASQPKSVQNQNSIVSTGVTAKVGSKPEFDSFDS